MYTNGSIKKTYTNFTLKTGELDFTLYPTRYTNSSISIVQIHGYGSYAKKHTVTPTLQEGEKLKDEKYYARPVKARKQTFVLVNDSPRGHMQIMRYMPSTNPCVMISPLNKDTKEKDFEADIAALVADLGNISVKKVSEFADLRPEKELVEKAEKKPRVKKNYFRLNGGSTWGSAIEHIEEPDLSTSRKRYFIPVMYNKPVYVEKSILWYKMNDFRASDWTTNFLTRLQESELIDMDDVYGIRFDQVPTDDPDWINLFDIFEDLLKKAIKTPKFISFFTAKYQQNDYGIFSTWITSTYNNMGSVLDSYNQHQNVKMAIQCISETKHSGSLEDFLKTDLGQFLLTNRKLFWSDESSKSVHILNLCHYFQIDLKGVTDSTLVKSIEDQVAKMSTKYPMVKFMGSLAAEDIKTLVEYVTSQK